MAVTPVAQVSAHGTVGTGKTRLHGDLAVGDDVTRTEPVEHPGDRLGEGLRSHPRTLVPCRRVHVVADDSPSGSRPPPQDLHHRCVVITGASRGLGSALAQRAAQLGATVAGCARSRPDPSLTLGATVDVGDHGAVNNFAASVVRRLGPIDLWINNAAVIDPLGPLRDRSEGDVTRILDTNVAGVWNGTVAFLRHRREQGGGGALVNISSGVALRASAGTGLYSASKAAVDRLTEATALEEADQGIDAWAIHPGVVDTAMQTSLRTADPADFPRAAEFQQLADLNAFNTGSYVADWLFAIAFDPRYRPPSVVWRLPDERTRPSAPPLGAVDAEPAR